MNSKQVLDKVLALLSLTKSEVSFTYAKLKDGTIVESPTFDVGEPIDVVSEDGSKTPAPDGEHELSLRDSSGNENLIKVITKDGKIVERENVELPSSEEEMKTETVKVEPMPGDVFPKKDEQMAEVEPLPSGDGVEDSVEPMPGEDEVIDMKKMYESMAYRIEELEKRIAKMEAMPVEDKKEADVKMEDVKVPKLDGAPVEQTNLSAIYKAKSNKNMGGNSQDSFLSKLYN